MRINPGNHQHIGARSEQQDSFAFSDLSDASFLAHGGALAVLADGMGGHAEGADASRIAVREFLEAYTRKSFEETIEESLDRSIYEANEAVYAFAAEKGITGNCGTTLVAAVIHGSGIYWIHAGDSRLYITDGQSLTPLTEDHIYAKDLDRAVEKGFIDEEKALSHPDREALTSYLGDSIIAKLGKGALPASAEGLPPNGFTLLLCSDGLYKTLQEDRMIEVYSKDPQEWSRALVEMTIEEGLFCQDNVTVLCLDVAVSNGWAFDHACFFQSAEKE